MEGEPAAIVPALAWPQLVRAATLWSRAWHRSELRRRRQLFPGYRLPERCYRPLEMERQGEDE
jgi:hypothetical protein